MFDGSFCTKIVLEGYALHILEPIQEFCFVNGTIFEFSDLQSNLVICYRSIDNVIKRRNTSVFYEKALSLRKGIFVFHTMKYSIRDIFEYIIALINEFAKRYSLTEKQAYRYIRPHNGIAYIEENYGAMHTLSFDDAVESVTLYCRRTGGEL